MAKFKCVNKKCEDHEKVEEIARCKWIWDPIISKLVAEERYRVCPTCGKSREELPKDWEGFNTNFRNPEKTYSKHSKGTIY